LRARGRAQLKKQKWLYLQIIPGFLFAQQAHFFSAANQVAVSAFKNGNHIATYFAFVNFSLFCHT